MERGNHLKNMLQTQLATDLSAVRHLPYCLLTLTAECLQSSSHLVKWTMRIHSLLHSKEPGGRWAGLCLAYKSSVLSQSLMIDSAQSWIGVALPLFSRNEPLPTIKAAIRLMRVIFSTATDIPEFQRQVSLPYVVKFTAALIPLADNHPDVELKVMCMETLTRLIPLYSTTHRASSNALSAFALRYLSGSVTSPTNNQIMHAASQLYAILPLTGGKVGAVNLWRKTLDETLAFGWDAFFSLRTTFPIEGQNTRPQPPNDEPQIAIPLNQDRLKCSAVILCNLLSTIVQRPVQIPVGNLVKFITALLSSSTDKQIEGFVDPSVRALEIFAVPGIRATGSELLAYLATMFPYRLDTHSGRLTTILVFQLEQKQSSHQRLPFLKALDALLKNCHPSDSFVISTRLAKAVLPTLTKMLATTSKDNPGSQASSSKSRNGKKRARNYEGDEIFNISREIAYPTTEDGEVLLTSIDVLQALFKNPNLSSSIRSIIARIVISILIALPRTSTSSLSEDPRLFELVNMKIQTFSVMIGCGTTSVLSKTLPFVVEATVNSNCRQIQDEIAMLLHPRLPPIVRSMPHVESLSLFRAEEPQEETEALAALAVEAVHTHQAVATQGDVVMSDHTTTIVPAVTTQASQIELRQLQGIASPTHPSQPKISNELFNIPTASSSKIDVESVAADAGSGYTIAVESKTEKNSLPTSYTPVVFSPPQDDEDEDEEMPAINMDSDSEGED